VLGRLLCEILVVLTTAQPASMHAERQRWPTQQPLNWSQGYIYKHIHVGFITRFGTSDQRKGEWMRVFKNSPRWEQDLHPKFYPIHLLWPSRWHRPTRDELSTLWMVKKSSTQSGSKDQLKCRKQSGSKDQLKCRKLETKRKQTRGNLLEHHSCEDSNRD